MKLKLFSKKGVGKHFILKQLFISTLLACTRFAAAQENPPHYRMDPVTDATGTLTLADLAESVEYIPLETTDKCLLGTIYRFDISENYILVACSKAEGCFLFSRKTGRFLSAIGRKGLGPGEYTDTPTGCMLDEKNQRAIVVPQAGMENPKVMYFDFHGKFIKQLTFDNIASPMPARLRAVGNGRTLIMYSNFTFDMPCTYEIWSDGKTLKRAIKPVYSDRIPRNYFFSGEFFNYSYRNRIYVKSGILNDTVYEIRIDNTFVPAYTLNNGRSETTVGDLLERIANNFSDFSRVAPEHLFETRDYLFMAYFLNKKREYVYFDKQKKKSLHFSVRTGIPNDYDGGLDFFPQAQCNDRFVAFYDAFRFFDEQPNRKNTVPKGPPAAVQSYRKMLQKLDPEDNPVVVIVKIKQ
jgi:hypothetical protein